MFRYLKNFWSEVRTIRPINFFNTSYAGTVWQYFVEITSSLWQQSIETITDWYAVGSSFFSHWFGTYSDEADGHSGQSAVLDTEGDTGGMYAVLAPAETQQNHVHPRLVAFIDDTSGAIELTGEDISAFSDSDRQLLSETMAERRAEANRLNRRSLMECRDLRRMVSWLDSRIQATTRFLDDIEDIEQAGSDPEARDDAHAALHMAMQVPEPAPAAMSAGPAAYYMVMPVPVYAPVELLPTHSILASPAA